MSREYIRMFARHLRNAVDACRDLTKALMAIDVMGAEERERILVGYNQTAGIAAPQSTIQGLFEQQTSRTPENDAVRTADRTISYDALNRVSNKLARFLQSTYGIERGDVVGVVSHRSDLMIAGILGTLKAGAVYLPIDPDYPEERLQFERSQ